MPRSAKKESSPSSSEMEMQPVQKEQAQQSPDVHVINPETDLLTEGELAALFMPDGQEYNATVIQDNNESGRVVAFENGQVLSTSQMEESARSEAAESYESISNAMQSAVDAVIVASGLKGAEADKIRNTLHEQESQLLLEAVLTDNPEKSMVDLVQKAVDSNENIQDAILEGKTFALSDALSEKMHATEAARQAEQNGDESAYQDAINQIYASENLINGLRNELHPNADSEEVEQIALDTRGAVEVRANPIYDQGIEAVKARLTQLETDMNSADKENNEIAWNIARTEYDQHSAIMPVLELAQNVKDTVHTIEDQLRSARLSAAIDATETNTEITYATGIAEGLEQGIKQVEDAMREVDASPATKEAEGTYQSLTADRKTLQKNLGEWQQYLKGLNRQYENLVNTEVMPTLEQNKAVENDQIAMYRLLEDQYMSNPERTMEYVHSIVENGQSNEYVRKVVQLFEADVKTGVINETVDAIIYDQEIGDELDIADSDILSSEKITETESTERKYDLGNEVTIVRSNGKEESGWTIAQMFDENDKYDYRVIRDAVDYEDLKRLAETTTTTFEEYKTTFDSGEKIPMWRNVREGDIVGGEALSEDLLDTVPDMKVPEMREADPSVIIDDEHKKELDKDQATKTETMEDEFFDKGKIHDTEIALEIPEGSMQLFKELHAEVIKALNESKITPEAMQLPSWDAIMNPPEPKTRLKKFMSRFGKTQQEKNFEKFLEVKYDVLDRGLVKISEAAKARMRKSISNLESKGVNLFSIPISRP